MKHSLFKTIIILSILLFSHVTFATKYIDFIGLEWGANDDWRPNFIVGYKTNDNVDFDSSNVDSRVYGWGTSISIGWDGIERFKIFKIEGYPYVQLELGAGYNFYENLPMFNVGVQSKIYIIDFDMLFDGGYKNHIGFNTIDGY